MNKSNWWTLVFFLVYVTVFLTMRVIPDFFADAPSPESVQNSNQNWVGVASSADGAKLVMCEYNGQIHTSTDSGATWVKRETKRLWAGVASSADGTKLVAVESGGFIYISTDSGITWTPRFKEKCWTGVTSSADGSKLNAVVCGGRIYTSSNSGVTWELCGTKRDNSLEASNVGETMQVTRPGGEIMKNYVVNIVLSSV